MKRASYGDQLWLVLSDRPVVSADKPPGFREMKAALIRAIYTINPKKPSKNNSRK